MTDDKILVYYNIKISIHIPRVGDDTILTHMTSGTRQFQSTSPVWGMTAVTLRYNALIKISIHIPRVGDDPT